MRRVSAFIPNRLDTAVIAAHSLGQSSLCSSTRRTAFARVSGSYLLGMTCTFPRKEVRIKRGMVHDTGESTPGHVLKLDIWMRRIAVVTA